MKKKGLKPLSAQYRQFACLMLAFSLLMTGMVSFIIFRGMYMDRRDRFFTESLVLANNDLTRARVDIAHKATEIHVYLKEFVDAYCQAANPSEKMDEYRKISDVFADSIFSSENYSRLYSIYLVFPDSIQIGWPMVRTPTQGNYFMFRQLPRQYLDVDLPAGIAENSSFWVYENNPNFNDVLFFALEVPIEDSSYLIVIGVRPETVFPSGNYGNMALSLNQNTLLRFSSSTPFTGSELSNMWENTNKGISGKFGSFTHGGQDYTLYNKIFSQSGALILAVPTRQSYPQLVSTALVYAAVGLILFMVFFLLIWKISPAIFRSLSYLSAELENNHAPFTRPIELPQLNRRTDRWMRRYSIRTNLMLLYIMGSIIPALLFLVFCTVNMQNVIAKTMREGMDESIAIVARSISDQLLTIQEIGKSIIFFNDTQAMMMTPAESSKVQQYRDNLTEYLSFLQPDVSHTNSLFINAYNLEGKLLYSTHSIFSFSASFNQRAKAFIEDESVRKQWFYESVGNTNVYSFYRKAYKKSVDPLDVTDVPINPIGFPHIGYLQVGILEPTLRNQYALLNLSEGIECMILDADKIMISNMDSHLIGLDVATAYPAYSVREEQNQQTLYRYSISKPIENSDGWSLFVLVEDHQLAEANLRILFFSSYVLMVVMLLVWLFTWLILTKIKRPLDNLLILTQQQNSISLPKPYVYTGQTDEVSALVKSFNRMLERLQEQIDIRQTVEKQRQEAELIALQSQINPHFLYNVFTSISFMMLRSKIDDAANMLDMVGRLFRTGIYRGNPIVAMEEELRHVRTYLDIQLIRYSHKLSVNYNLDPCIYQYRILKLTLQPLVENSIYHGIEIKDGSGTIDITAKILPDTLQFIIRDDGVGIEQNELNEIQIGLNQRNLSRGIGLKNVNERIKLYFGDEYGLLIESAHQGGTTVVMTIPLISSPQQEDDKPCTAC